MIRLLVWLLGGLLGIIVLAVVAWFAYGLYVERVVAASPATVPILTTSQGDVELAQYANGDQVLAAQDSAAAAPPVPTGRASELPTSATPATPRESTPTPLPQPTSAAVQTPGEQAYRPILPPTRLKIARIDLDVPIILADNEEPPSFKAVGWFTGTGYPGFRGNVVLYGLAAGDLATLERLGELAPGDEVVVEAMDQSYRYVVGGSRLVSGGSTEWLLPSADRRLTLITSAGDYDPGTHTYSQRLVVVATLAGE